MRLKTWADFDEEGPNEATIVGSTEGEALLVTCAGIHAEFIREELDSSLVLRVKRKDRPNLVMYVTVRPESQYAK
jgi:hypothetical protein